MALRLRDSMRAHPFVWIAGLGLAVRVGLVATTHYTPVGDPADYDRIARSIAGGHGYGPSLVAAPGTASAYRPPGYPVLLALVYRLSGDSWTAGRLLGAVLGSAAVFAIMVLADWLRDRPTAVLAGLIAAVYPPLLNSGTGALLSESLFIPLVLAALVAALAYRRTQGALRWAVIAGLLCGIAALTRGNGALLLIPTAIALGTAAGTSGRHRGIALISLVVTFVLVLTPWTIRDFSALHGFVPISTELGPTAAAVYNPAALPRPPDQPAPVPKFVRFERRPGVGERDFDAETRREAIDFIGDHPTFVTDQIWTFTKRLVGRDRPPDLAARQAAELGVSAGRRTLAGVAFVIVFVLALVAVAGIAIGRFDRVGSWWFWLAPVLLFLSTVILVGSPRYRAPLDPFLILLAATMLSEVRRRWLRAAAAAAH